MKRGVVSVALIILMPVAGWLLGAGCAGSKHQAREAPAQMDKLREKKPVSEEGMALGGAEKEDIRPATNAPIVPSPSPDPEQAVVHRPNKEAPSDRVVNAQGSPIPAVRKAKELQASPRAEAPAGLPSINATETGKTRPAGEEQKIVFNFDDADLYEVIKALGELLQISYLVDPGIKGKVTIHTAGGIRKEDLFPVFFQILEANGLTAIKEGPIYKIFQGKEASRMPLAGEFRIRGKGDLRGERVIIEVIPLQFISAEEVTKLLAPFLSAGGTIVPDAGSNTIVVVDNSPNVSKVLQLVEVFDVNIFERLNHRFYSLVNVSAAEAAKVLNDVFASHGKASLAYAKFIAIEKINTVLVLTSNPRLFKKIDELVQELDRVDNEVTRKMYVYFVKNGAAKDLGEVLNKAFQVSAERETKTSGKATEAGGSTQRTGNPFSKARVEEKKAEKKAEEAAGAEAKPKAETGASEAQPQQTAAKAGAPQDERGGVDSLKSEVKITMDEVRNALIIEAVPSDYRIVADLLKQLDVLPRQVLIEATIAEISREASKELGMNWALGAGAALGAASFAASVGETGLKYSIGVSNKWFAELQALASKNKVNVLSSPHVLASDNKEARIDVSREIPVASSQTMYGTATAVTETAIEYRDTGVILIVTPHINEHGMVTMDIQEEVSDLEKTPILVAGKEYPAFFKRTISTTLTVKDGQTIAIGGLIKDKEDDLISGVPCLIDIPVVRYLFGKYSQVTEKNELIVLITPRVIDNMSDVDLVTQEFKSKVINVIEKFNR
jgi:general secretion pathway protein D